MGGIGSVTTLRIGVRRHPQHAQHRRNAKPVAPRLRLQPEKPQPLGIRSGHRNPATLSAAHAPRRLRIGAADRRVPGQRRHRDRRGRQESGFRRPRALPRRRTRGSGRRRRNTGLMVRCDPRARRAVSPHPRRRRGPFTPSVPPPVTGATCRSACPARRSTRRTVFYANRNRADTVSRTARAAPSALWSSTVPCDGRGCGTKRGGR